ncbi:Glycosyl transferase family 1 OS=Rhizobacter sp. OX=1736433 GN=ASC87_05250 PE=4 SV=1 [Rhizobacter fulvus]
MRELGAREVMTFPFGLEALPPESGPKQPWLVFANRGLEPLYRPQRMLALFATLARYEPRARLVVANDGTLAGSLPGVARALGLSVGKVDAGAQVEFVGRLDQVQQDFWYARAAFYLSVPASDSVSVSVLEAMAQGCIPLLSDLPANRELIESSANGLIISDAAVALELPMLLTLDAAASQIAARNRAWIARHGLFAPAVARFVARLQDGMRS